MAHLIPESPPFSPLYEARCPNDACLKLVGYTESDVCEYEDMPYEPRNYYVVCPACRESVWVGKTRTPTAHRSHAGGSMPTSIDDDFEPQEYIDRLSEHDRRRIARAFERSVRSLAALLNECDRLTGAPGGSSRIHIGDGGSELCLIIGDSQQPNPHHDLYTTDARHRVLVSAPIPTGGILG